MAVIRRESQASGDSRRLVLMTEIVAIRGREILDSRGNPTLEVELATLGGFVGRAAFNPRRGRM